MVNLYANNSSDFPIKTKKEKEKEKQITNYLLLYKKFKRYLPVIHKDKLSYTNIIHASLDIMLNRISELQMEINNPDIIVNINRNCSSTFEFYRAKELIEIGRNAAKYALDQYEAFGR